MGISKLSAGAVLGVAMLAPGAGASVAVLVNPLQLPLTGTQNFNNVFGNDFNVNTPITVSKLGVFDNGQDGLKTNGTQPIVATIYNRANGVALATLGFGGNSAGGDGTLTQGFRFKSLATPVTLPVGQYSIVTDFYSQTPAENFYNANGNANTTVVRDTGGGAISFVGSGRYDAARHNVFPTGNIDTGTEPIHYNAGTFEFTDAPEPASLALAGVGAVGLLARRRRRGR